MKNLSNAIQNAIDKFPSQIAVMSKNKSITYAELNDKSTRLANAILSQIDSTDTKKQPLVAVCMSRDVDLVVAIIAIIRAGFAYVPIEPTYPKERIEYILNDSNVAMIITNKLSRQTLSTCNVKATELCIDHLDFEAYPNKLQNKPLEQKLAYIIYTSGSTGKPKGVLVTCENLLYFVTSQLQMFNYGIEHRFLLFSSICFDASVWSIFIPLTCGASTYVISDEERKSPDDVHMTISERHITDCVIPPAMLSMLPQKPLPKLQRLFSGGEVCPLKVVNYWSSQVDTYNVYGPTETTVYISMHKFRTNDINTNIGQILKGSLAILLDNELSISNTQGELCISGPSVALGYLNQPTKNKEAFIDIELDNKIHRFYRTGDIVKRLPNDEFEYIGRRDSQVKLRGYRIELGEIENCLMSHPHIEQSAVLVHEGDAQQQVLMAYFVATDNKKISSDQLRSYVSENLPEYMMPNIFLQLDEFPITSNEKIDRAKLPSPDSLRSKRQGTLPQTELEIQVAKIWSSHLAIAEIFQDDNFFELGGNSLQAARIIHDINNNHKLSLQVSDLFSYPKLHNFSDFVSNQRPSESHNLYNIQHIEGSTDAPVSFAEELMLRFRDQAQSQLERAMFNVIVQINLPSQAAEDRLITAVNAAIDQHDEFKCYFELDGQNYKRIANNQKVQLLKVQTDQQGLDNLVSTQLNQPFATGDKQLARFYLITNTDDYSKHLLINIDHTICDAISINILIREIEEHYQNPNSQQKQTITYADYSHWMSQFMQTERFSKQALFWKQYLNKATPLQLKQISGNKNHQDEMGLHKMIICSELVSLIDEIAKRCQTSRLSVLVLAYNYILESLVINENITYIIPYTYRMNPQLSSIFGCFAHHYVYQFTPNKSLTVEQELKRCFSEYMLLTQNQDIPTLMLLSMLNESQINAQELIKFSLIYQNEKIKNITLDGETGVVESIYQKHTFEHLCFEFFEQDSELELVIQYNKGSFSSKVVESIGRKYEQLLIKLTANTEKTMQQAMQDEL